MGKTITIKELKEKGVQTMSVKDNSPRGIHTISTSDVKVGDYVVLDNHFVKVISNTWYVGVGICNDDVCLQDYVDFFDTFEDAKNRFDEYVSEYTQKILDGSYDYEKGEKYYVCLEVNNEELLGVLINNGESNRGTK